MKLLTGSTGMIGRNLKELLPPMLCPTHAELDLMNFDDTRHYLQHTQPEVIIHCASNDDEICLEDNLRMFVNLAQAKIPMITFATGRDVEDRPGKNGQYILSKYITQELAFYKYEHILVIKLWGCFGKYEKSSRFLMDNILRVKANLPIIVKENKLFSYVYVKDLATIINTLEISNCLLPIVGYTDTLLNYALLLKKVTNSPYEIIVEKDNFGSSYIGKNGVPMQFTPLETAIKELYENT